MQEFTSTGTWTKPAGAHWCVVEAIAPGGGGAGGQRGATATLRNGGGGGSAGGACCVGIDAAELSATETVTIGAAGTGGAGATVDTTVGVDGSNGGDCTFGSHLTVKGGIAASKVAGIFPGCGGYNLPTQLVSGLGGTASPNFTTGLGTSNAAGFPGTAGGGGSGANVTAGNLAAVGNSGGNVAGLGESQTSVQMRYGVTAGFDRPRSTERAIRWYRCSTGRSRAERGASTRRPRAPNLRRPSCSNSRRTSKPRSSKSWNERLGTSAHRTRTVRSRIHLFASCEPASTGMLTVPSTAPSPLTVRSFSP